MGTLNKFNLDSSTTICSLGVVAPDSEFAPLIAPPEAAVVGEDVDRDVGNDLSHLLLAVAGGADGRQALVFHEEPLEMIQIGRDGFVVFPNLEKTKNSFK